MAHSVTTYKMDHGIMECFDVYLVYTLQGSEISAKIASEILRCADTHYQNKPYVFISNRAFSSDVDPKAYKEVNPKTMVGLAIVSEDASVKQEAVSEQHLYEGAFSFFKTVEQAIGWARTVIRD
ncbi:hypothetical protein ULMS_09810 [Patiriisocius marinistellae]|uniref:Uncharacterized protein n=1 Tax=Patiriisocius marinistellae TaxID=2494560 RepID=A0A5J4FUI3_9FLAO|nr:thymidylate synthase [Patiriisocius marinistellae]GEQ85473.1 hypothetical protein ULMS_09810 [Patiriisocius marinistellae]